MKTKPYSLQAPEAIAKEYGGNKQAIQQAALTGLVDPTAAVLAGMFIDTMRSAAALENVPNQTIYEKTFAPPQAQAPAGLGATPQAQAMPSMQPPAQPLAAAPAQPTAMLADGGLASLPVDESMFPDEYAGGGVVAFSGGSQEPINYRLLSKLTDPERERYYRTGELPARLQYPQADPLGGRHFKDVPVWEDVQLGGVAPGMTSTDMLLGRYDTTPIAKSAAAAPAAGPAAAPPVKPPAAPPLKDFKDTDTGVDLTGITPPAPSIEDYKDLQAKFGVSDKAEKTIQGIIDKLSGEGKSDRELAKNMALLQTGLGIMAGTSPYALQNIGKGAMEGVSQYGKDIKDIKAAEREISKLQIAQANAEDARARGDLKGYQDYVDKAQDHAVKLRKLGIDERVAAAQIKYYGRPGTYEELGQAGEKYPWLKERFTAGADTLEAKVRQAAEAYVNDPMLRAQDPKLKDLAEKAKKGDVKAVKDLEAYKDKLRKDYISRNLPGARTTGDAGGKSTVQWADIP